MSNLIEGQPIHYCLDGPNMSYLEKGFNPQKVIGMTRTTIQGKDIHLIILKLEHPEHQTTRLEMLTTEYLGWKEPAFLLDYYVSKVV